MLVSFTNYFNKTRFDNRRRQAVVKLENKRVFFRWIVKKSNLNKMSSVTDKLHYHILVDRMYILKRNYSRSRVVNRCIITDTPHSVNKEFRLSRMSFKESVASRFITGVTQLPVRK